MAPRDRLDTAAPPGSALRQLACVASLAVRVDTPLLRQLRLDLVPAAGAATEFDLWFSDLLESRDDQYLVFDADIAALLRSELAALHLPDGRHLLDLAHAVLARQHAQWADAHRLEETLTYLGLCAAAGRAPAVDAGQLLAPALAAMASGAERAREVARWARRALPRLPAAALQGEAATTLDMASALHLDMPLALPADGRPQPLPAALRWLLPGDGAAGTLELALEVRSDALVLHLPDEARHALPRIVLQRSRPLLVELQVALADQAAPASVHTLAVRPGVPLPLPPGWARLELRNLAGQGWQVTRARTAPPAPRPAERKTCYVAMGFGKKTDHRTGRVLDLDKTYRRLVKPAVEGAGLQCVRADELPAAGLADAQVLEHLLAADLVIVDLSTSNLNAAYELGIRHALRPHGTLVIAEEQFASPFDGQLFTIRRYRHDGQALDIDATEAFRAQLGQAIVDLMGHQRADSPVYTVLPIDPPQRPASPGAGWASAPPPPTGGRQPQCYVVMGFGEKTDDRTGRVLDLDKSYRRIIRKAVEDAGLACTRADEIPGNLTIDEPAYDRLLEADLVVADLSTGRLNTAYELGVRHALRPAGTLVVAESGFEAPFSASQVRILRYRHDGRALDIDEAERARSELAAAVRAAMASPQVDSPVYQLLAPLRPPRRPEAPDTPETPEAQAVSLASLLQAAEAHRRNGEWAAALALLQTARELAPNDARVIRQLATATYRNKQPDAVAALQAAVSILQPLAPMAATDTETLELWAAVHKRLFDNAQDPAALDTAIDAYGRSFQQAGGYYAGINQAFLLDLRAARDTGRKQALADALQAQQVRREVAALCERLLAAATPDSAPEERFWIIATQAEAVLGDGLPEAEERAAALLATLPPNVEGFMREAITEQHQKLRELLRAGPLASRPPPA